MSVSRIISSDSHFVEPPKMWAERLDRRFRDRAPRAVRLEGKPSEYFVCEDLAPAPIAAFFSAGVPAAEMPEFMRRGFDDAPKAVHDPAERIRDQDRDGVGAEVIYTSMGMPLFGLADAEFRAACFRAFNDWATDYCSYDLKRLIPLGLITLEDIPAAIAELTRIKSRGMAGAMIWGEAPADRPYSHPDYDPFWAAAQDLEMPLSLHILTGAKGTGGHASGVLNANMKGVEFMTAIISMVHPIERSMTAFVFGGVFERFPRLKIVSAENDVAWLPFFLYRIDKYAARGLANFKLPLKPSEYIKRQVWATFINDPVFVNLLDWFPADNIMWSSDYPHGQATFPHSQDYVAEHLSKVSETERRKIMHDTVAKLYGLN
jgi:predicted TIM-barrel fold metal-dependent hydrolase